MRKKFFKIGLHVHTQRDSDSCLAFTFSKWEASPLLMEKYHQGFVEGQETGVVEVTVVGGSAMDVEEGVEWEARVVGALETGMLGWPY